MAGFSQLMMRKKSEPVEYIALTKIGSPTISNNIVSNFYTSRYLKISSGISFSINFEMVFKFMVTSAVNNHALFNFGGVSSNESTIRLTAQFTSSLSIWCCFRYNGTSDQLSIDTTNNKVTLNQWYYIKYKYNNSTIEMYLSANGTTWELLGSKSATINSLTISDCVIGNRTLSTERYFRGSIDLSPEASYLRIDNQKYIYSLPQ